MSDAYLPPRSDVASDQQFANPPVFSPQGRIGRVRYLAHNFWVTTIVQIIGTLLIGAAGAVGESLVYITAILVIAVLVAVVFIFTIKRSHDINISGWWSLLCLIPLVNLFFVFKSGTPTANRYGPVPGPNTVMLWLGAIVLPLFFFAGLLAAIAIPAYQDYTSRAQIMDSFVSTSAVKNSMTEFYQANNSWPSQNDLAQLDLEDPHRTRFATIYAQPNTGVIEVVMHDAPMVGPGIANGTLLFTPRIDNYGINYDCTSENINQRFLGSSCSGMESTD